ncbi:MAG: P-II family nitrogen regulator [Pirellulales bacterium]
MSALRCGRRRGDLRVAAKLVHSCEWAVDMKMIFAVIQPTKLDAVQQALARLDVTRMTVCDAMGYARQRGQLETYRGHEYKTNLLRKIALEIAVNDDFVDRTVDCLVDVARTSAEGHIGDGKIFVVPMEQAIQISDGYRGKGAI